ncbi:MAG: hypothetical protein IIZ68_08055, partial [Clostridia bacterium]|nr:hypothetical protein [Clostridia bacterium]
IQTRQSYMGYRILNGMQGSDVLKPMPADSLVYTGHYIDHEFVANLDADCDARTARKAAGKPMRFLLTIGGAGAQRELFQAIIKHLLPAIASGKAALYVNVGDYKKVWDELCKKIKGLKEVSTEHFNHWSDTNAFAQSAMDGDVTEKDIRQHYEGLSERDKGKDWKPFNSMLRLLRQFNGLRIYQL